MTDRLAEVRIGGAAIAGSFARAAPTVVVTAPLGTIVTDTPTITWSYTTTVSRAQQFWRVRLMSEDGTVTIADSTRTAGTATSWASGYALSSGSTYQINVSVEDGIDTGVGTALFTYDNSSATTWPTVTSVGSVYEIAVNGVGYMLADHPDKELAYRRQVVPLEPTRFATSDTPFSQNIDRYAMIGSIDWSEGAGQRFANRDASSPKQYLSSTGVNPFTPGSVQLLPATTLKNSSAYATQFAVVASNKVFVSTADRTLSSYADPTTVSATTFTIAAAAASAPVAMMSDGVNWYYSDGANVFRGATAADPGAAWSAVDATLMEWCSNRVVIARIGTGSTPNVVESLDDTGVAVGGAETWTMKPGTTARSITSGDGYIFWAATRENRSTIYSWQIGSATSNYSTALEMPSGLEAISIFYYQGNVMIRARELTGTASKRAVIYRAAVNGGLLIPTRLLEINDTAIDHGDGSWAADDRFVFFSWQAMDTNSGVGCIDLSTGGWSKWLVGPAGTGRARSVLQWYGRTCWSTDGYGLVIEQIDSGAGNDNTVTTGTLNTSLFDLKTGFRKAFHEVRITFDPLPSGSSVQLKYSLDGGSSFINLGTVTGAGSKYGTWTIEAESDSVSFQVVLGHSTTTTPVVRTIVVKAHSIGIADQVLTLPINCADQVAGMNGRLVPESAVGAGARRARTLEALSQTKVRVQDIDWPLTGVTQTYDVVGTETRSVGVFDRTVARQSQAQVTVMTLRRSFK